MDSDPFEELFARGVTDGLPVVPPTRERVARAVAAAGRAADELVALVPPNLGRATVERIAINAVMAGCRPEYLPVVLAGVEAMCDEGLALVGVSGTTDAVAPLFIVNGPARAALDINSGVGLFGPGWRANATIGRALRLVWLNIGGARPGAPSMSTFAQTGRFTYLIGEGEEESPWEPLHVEHGFEGSASTVAALAAEAPQIVADYKSRSAADLLTTVARSLEVIANHRAMGLGDTVIVFAPEHARTLAQDGWSKAEVRGFLWERTRKRVRDLIPGRDGAEGLSEQTLAAYASPETDETLVAKFKAPESLKLLVAGGPAGRFTAIIPGWPFAEAPSRLVLKKIRM
jgi:hypothetical protein